VLHASSEFCTGESLLSMIMPCYVVKLCTAETQQFACCIRYVKLHLVWACVAKRR